MIKMKIKKLTPMDAESCRLIDWMEKGVYDALQKKYPRTLLFCVCEGVEGSMIEEYAFAFSYSNSKSHEWTILMKLFYYDNVTKDNVFNQREHMVLLLANQQTRLGIPDELEPIVIGYAKVYFHLQIVNFLLLVSL
ncbi:hypothetical protein ACSBR1_011593 [Camellia fascicularis]